MSSRTWGNGGINWAPGNVQAHVFTVYGKKTEVRTHTRARANEAQRCSQPRVHVTQKKRRVVINWHTGEGHPRRSAHSRLRARRFHVSQYNRSAPFLRGAVSDLGNFRNVPVTLEGIDEETTVSDLKTILGDKLSSD
eukprot:652126-Prymnesium_polylepis.1